MASNLNGKTGYKAGAAWNSPGVTVTARKKLPDDPSCQPCPDCGGLQCLCRPRFFAGQLLTEKDLNRLDTYIVEKHKLHNRHLFGSGVVCGLQVRCNPCGNAVTVSSGYALSPCGEDIVVCSNDTVDICALISQCRRKDESDCRPYGNANGGCEDIEEQWVLAIRYAETPSKGITPLVGASSCGCSTSKGGCGCGCSGSSSAGCCGGVKMAPRPETPTLRRGAPPSCEPTLTCETYRYEVFRAPDTPDKPGVRDGLAGLFGSLEGEMIEKIRCCFEKLQKAIPAPPGNIQNTIPVADQTKWRQWCYRTRQSLMEFFTREGSNQCERLEQLQAIVCPSPTQDAAAFTQAMQQASVKYALMMIEGLIDCICFAALPACPVSGDPRVPLATVTVRGKSCDVVSVCNWTPLRKHVLTFPTLNYWFGWIPVGKFLRQAMHNLCCHALGLRDQFDRFENDAVIKGNVAAAAPAAATAAHMKSAPLEQDIPLNMASFDGVDTMLAEAIAMRMAGGEALRSGDLVQAMLSRSAFRSADPLDPQSRGLELDRLTGTGQVRVLAELLRPFGGIVASLSGAAMRDVKAERRTSDSVEADGVGASAAARGASELDELRNEVSALQAAVAELQKNRRTRK